MESILKGVEVKTEWCKWGKDSHWRYHLYIFGTKLGEFRDSSTESYSYEVVSLVDEAYKEHGLSIMRKWGMLQRAKREDEAKENFAKQQKRQEEEKRRLQDAVNRQLDKEIELPPGQCKPSGDRFWSWLFGVGK